MAEQQTTTFTRLSSSGVIGDSGQPIDMYGYAILSGGTAAAVTFKNGVDATGAAAFQGGPITVSQSNVLSLPAAVRFPKGLYVSFDANTTSVSIFWVQALTA